ncbi:unnamed protein product, partial [Rotaria magnacalcarata]
SLSTTSVEYGSSGSTITTEAESGSSSIIIIETERGSSSSSTIIIEQTRAIISQEKNNSSLISLSNRHVKIHFALRAVVFVYIFIVKFILCICFSHLYDHIQT